MIDRGELIDAGVTAAGDWHSDPEEVARILGAVEPLIRADERGRIDATIAWVREDERATVRAKVEALPPLQMRRPDDMYAAYVQRADVLALIDGNSE